MADGTTLVEGTVADTCEVAGLRAVCAGDKTSSHYSARCDIIDFEVAAHVTSNPMNGLSG